MGAPGYQIAPREPRRRRAISCHGRPLDAYLEGKGVAMRKGVTWAASIVVLGARLYAELTRSALQLLPGRR
jgi:hypothetical protein